MLYYLDNLGCIIINERNLAKQTMDNIFSSKNEENRESVEKLNLDDLYDQKKQEDLAKLYTFNRILTRVHDKIKVAARQKNSQQFCWFLVPEMLIGVPNYDKNMCITYIISKLEENDFSATSNTYLIKIEFDDTTIYRTVVKQK